jgi:hypothetical protein
MMLRMLRITFSGADLDALRYWRFQHPDPRIQRRMEALYARSQGVANGDILRRCNLSKASLHCYLHAYVTGGFESVNYLQRSGRAVPSTGIVRRSKPSFGNIPPRRWRKRRRESKPSLGVRTGRRRCGSF